MIADEGCAERGCACLNPLVDGPGVRMMRMDEAELAYNRLSMLHSEALLRIQDLERQLARQSLWFRIKLFFRRDV